MKSMVELNRGEYAQLAFISILERIGERRKTLFSSLLVRFPGGNLAWWQASLTKLVPYQPNLVTLRTDLVKPVRE